MAQKLSHRRRLAADLPGNRVQACSAPLREARLRSLRLAIGSGESRYTTAGGLVPAKVGGRLISDCWRVARALTPNSVPADR